MRSRVSIVMRLPSRKRWTSSPSLTARRPKVDSAISAWRQNSEIRLRIWSFFMGPGFGGQDLGRDGGQRPIAAVSYHYLPTLGNAGKQSLPSPLKQDSAVAVSRASCGIPHGMPYKSGKRSGRDVDNQEAGLWWTRWWSDPRWFSQNQGRFDRCRFEDENQGQHPFNRSGCANTDKVQRRPAGGYVPGFQRPHFCGTCGEAFWYVQGTACRDHRLKAGNRLSRCPSGGTENSDARHRNAGNYWSDCRLGWGRKAGHGLVSSRANRSFRRPHSRIACERGQSLRRP